MQRWEEFCQFYTILSLKKIFPPLHDMNEAELMTVNKQILYRIHLLWTTLVLFLMLHCKVDMVEKFYW